MSNQEKIISYKDMDVFQGSYEAMLIVMKSIVNNLPQIEQYDLKSQLSRSCKAIPRLIAEGYAKRHQKAGFQKYLDDAMAECNEMCVSLSQFRDLYCENKSLCDQLIDRYDKFGRQLFLLARAWDKFKR